MKTTLQTPLKNLILDLTIQKKKLMVYLEVTKTHRGVSLGIYQANGLFEQVYPDNALNKSLTQYLEHHFELPWEIVRYHTAVGQFMIDETGEVCLKMTSVNQDSAVQLPIEKHTQKIVFPELQAYITSYSHQFKVMMEGFLGIENAPSIRTWAKPHKNSKEQKLPPEVHKACENIIQPILQACAQKELLKGIRPVIQVNVFAEINATGTLMLNIEKTIATVYDHPSVCLY
ncbi:hypothetical protein BKI52_02180 [marine bacterium AO1-C]|nr:hypothetical protein BKI52_02180 [marine bacterium AO1-C]